MFSSTSYTELEEFLRTQMSEKRFLHSKKTAETCVTLAEQFHEDLSPSLCYLCGLVHDFVREWSNEKLVRYAQEHALVLEKEEMLLPQLLHGPVAAHLLQKEGYDPSLCLAVRYHTLGNVAMGRLGLVLFIADYLEPGRTHLAEVTRQKLLSLPSLEAICLQILYMQEAYFSKHEKCKAVSSSALETYLQGGGRL